MLLEKSREELVNKTKEAFKVFAPMSTFLGFVGDIIKPLAPILHYVSAFFLGTTIILLIMLLVDRRRGRSRKLTQYLPHSVILAIVLAVFSAMGFGHKDGFFGTNFDVVHSFQVNVMGVEPAAPPEAEEKKEESPAGTLNLTIIDEQLDDIRELISQQKLQASPTEIRDYLVNAGIYYNAGNFRKAESMMDSVFSSGYLKLDLCFRYYEVLFANLDGDLGAIGKKLDSMGLTGNDMMKIAGLDFNLSGVDYYRELENTSITDPLIRAVAENMKAQSLIADSHNYWLYQPYLVARWIPVWTTNDELLGKNMIRAKKYFFDYPASYRRYQRGTAGGESDNLRWRTDVHHLSNDPYVLREAPALWRRVAGGAYSGAGKTLNVVQEGFVTDESGNPLEEVVVTDFDTYTPGSLEYNTASTDSAGHYQLTTGRNHLLRFEAIFDRQFRERFVTAGSETAGRVVIRRKK